MQHLKINKLNKKRKIISNLMKKMKKIYIKKLICKKKIKKKSSFPSKIWLNLDFSLISLIFYFF